MALVKIHSFILFCFQNTDILKNLLTCSRVTMRGQMFEPKHFEGALSRAIAKYQRGLHKAAITKIDKMNV